MLPKILIIGHARHGKDTLAEFLRDFCGMKFSSSSQFAVDGFIFESFKDKYNYKDSFECYDDRINHRQEFYDLICDFNKEDKSRLATEILKENDCYVGMRDYGEFEACFNKSIFDLVIWVDASERLPNESVNSFNIPKSCSDIIIDNNGNIEQLKERAKNFAKILKMKPFANFYV